MQNFHAQVTLNLKKIMCIFILLTFTGCSGSGPNPFGNDDNRSVSGITPIPTTDVEQKPLDNLQGTPSENGIAKVALILPLSATGNAGKTAQSLRNAAEMAFAELQNPAFEMIVIDDKGTPQGAAEAANQALSQNVELVLGPLFSPSVISVTQIMKPSNTPIIAYSTDVAVANSGTYLLSFLPQADVQRSITYAAKNGKKSFVALIPDNAYGVVTEQAFRQNVAQNGGTIISVERYPLDQIKMQEPIRRAAIAAKNADAVFISDASDTSIMVADIMRSNGLDLATKQVIGTGLWDDGKLNTLPAFANALYAAPEGTSWTAFKTRYKARYNLDPVRIASLSYDSVRLVAALARGTGIKSNTALITNPNGFSGIDGIFRFNPDGTNERSLAVLAVGGKVLSPAEKTFTSRN